MKEILKELIISNINKWNDEATYDEVEIVQEIPIIIHELEYYDEIAEQNIEANGRDLVSDFVEFCLDN